MDTEQIEHEVVVAASPDRVWEVITQAEHLGTWFGDAGADVDLRPGGKLSLHWVEHGTVHGVVEVVEPTERFVFRWAGPSSPDPTPGNATTVEFRLEPEGSGTRLTVVETGFGELSVPAGERAAYVDDNTTGWHDELDELRAYLAA